MNKVKRLLTIILTSLLLISLGAVTSNAASLVNIMGNKQNSLGSSVNIYWFSDKTPNLSGDNRLYCIERGEDLNYYGWANTYEVTHYIRIEGNKAERYIRKNSKVQKVNDISAYENAVLAYILSGGSDSVYGKGYGKNTPGRWSGDNVYDNDFMTTPRQKALWLYINTWRNKIEDKDFKLYSKRTNAVSSKLAQQLIQEAKNYANGVGSTSAASIKSLVGPNVTTSNTMAGPFKVQYTGKISKVEVKDANGNTISSGIGLYKDAAGRTKITASNIKSNENFYIKNTSGKRLGKLRIEVKSEKIKTAEIWFLHNNGNVQDLIAVNPGEKDGKPASVEINIRTYGDLKIVKIDKKTGAAINGVGFKIKTSNGWLQKTNSGYNYNQSFANATTFTTSNGNGVTLKDLNLGTYRVYEVSAPSEYPLNLQEGYDSEHKWVDFGIAIIDGSQQVVPKTITNGKGISIKGYVFVDIPETKANETDNLFNLKDVKVKDVKVQLINKSTNKQVAETTTDANGEYVFDKKVTESTIGNYYVRFDYQGTTYKNYIPVAFNSVDANQIQPNGSRALVNSMPEKDADFKGIATTYTGTAKENVYGLSGNLYNKLYNSSNETLENINLGIKAPKETEYLIEENIAYAKIVMKGYTYTYNYGGAGDKNLTAAPTVKWQSEKRIKGYSMPIYPSDVAYEAKNAKNDLKVYVVYRTDITNTTTYNLEESYVEDRMMVTNLTNKFDTARYELHDNNWTANGDTATIKGEYLNKIYGNGIEKNNTKTSFIEFEVKRDALLEILDTVKNPDGIIEKYPTQVTSTAHHIYKRKDYSWQNDINKEQTHRTIDDVRSSQAPYLIFRLGEKRQLSGTVFEDIAVTTDGQKLGNGTYESDKENRVKGVKVELLDIDGTVSDLYDVQNNVAVTRKANTTTDASGNYTITGIVPGDYLLKFTYADGSSKLCDLTGQEIGDVSAKDYKSTIVTSNIAIKALKGIEDNETVSVSSTVKEGDTNKKYYIWYKNLGATNYSVAVDNIGSRASAIKSEGTDNRVGTNAATAKLSITVESDAKDFTNVDQKDNGTEQEIANLASGSTPNFGGFNLGIILAPEQKVSTEKVITNLSIVNAQNNIVANGNPETNSMRGISDLDGITNGGSTYTRAELEEESIYGSTVEIKYEIRVKNESDVDYAGENYYYFGDSTGLQEVTLRVDEVIDNLDKTTQYIAEKSDKDRITEVDNGLSINGWGVLYTTKNTARTNNVRTSASAVLSARRILSTNDNDTEIVNIENVNKKNTYNTIGDGSTTNSTGTDSNPYIDVIRPVEILNEGKATLTITPPTGLDKLTIALYIVSGAAALALLSVGIVFIKKKVV